MSLTRKITLLFNLFPEKLSSSTPSLKKAQSLNSLSRWLKRKPQDDNENVESEGSSPKKLAYSEPFMDSSFTLKDISQSEDCKQVQNEDTASFYSSNETESVSDSGLSLSQPESSQSQTESYSSLSVYYHSCDTLSPPEEHTASGKSEEPQASESQEQEIERKMSKKSEVITKYVSYYLYIFIRETITVKPMTIRILLLAPYG